MTKVMFYDGNCNLCHHGVQFVLSFEQDHTLFFASLEGPIGQSFFKYHPELSSLDAILLLDTNTGTIHSGSQAVIEIARHLRWPWKMVQLISMFPASVRMAVYQRIARSRYRIFGKTQSCILPSQDTRRRFLDLRQ